MTITRDQLPDPLETKRFKRADPLDAAMRTFESGATRDSDDTKLDFEGFLSPLALTRYAEYMNLHRVQADGNTRASDNWQKGIPADTYVKSMFRHFMDLWTMHRGHVVRDRKDGHVIDSEEALCAVIFNAFGLLHETLVDKGDASIFVVIDEKDGSIVDDAIARSAWYRGDRPASAEAATDVQVQETACINCSQLTPADYTHGEF